MYFFKKVIFIVILVTIIMDIFNTKIKSVFSPYDTKYCKTMTTMSENEISDSINEECQKVKKFATDYYSKTGLETMVKTLRL
tara:strand:- start:55 stop:300 length:246 start_codon:yes stop_codon:yes gene_type:complete